MRLSDALTVQCIIEELESSDKPGVIHELARSLALSLGLDAEELANLAIEREKLGSTGIGFGVAMPHAKVRCIDNVRVAFGRSTKGVDFDSTDGLPARLIFLIAAPESSAIAHLKMLSAISSLLKSADFRTKLLSSPDRDAIARLIAEAEKKGATI